VRVGSHSRHSPPHGTSTAVTLIVCNAPHDICRRCPTGLNPQHYLADVFSQRARRPAHGYRLSRNTARSDICGAVKPMLNRAL
jgi:hypothetical protein